VTANRAIRTTKGNSGKMRSLITTDQERTEFIRRINQVELKGRVFTAEFKLFRKKRSLKSNNLYWMWINCIHNETGNDADDLHEYFAKKYLPWITKEVLGEEISRRISTTQLDSKQFTEYLDRIKAEMLNLGIYLPEPQEQGWEQFYVQYGIDK
jgi:hypothetical protein